MLHYDNSEEHHLGVAHHLINGFLSYTCYIEDYLDLIL